ncbi:MAG: ATP-grasp domain-containing protein [Longimicrobiales bacterium]
MTTILCIASYEKGADFLRACRQRGCHTILLTVESLKDADWPRDAIDAFYYVSSFGEREALLNAVSYLARSSRLDRIVPLDEFDLETAALLREHLRIPGMGETTVRRFRDKLAMRQAAAEAGVAVPPFTPVFNDQEVRDWTAEVEPPWMIKPRTDAASIGILKVDRTEDVFEALEAMGDRRSRCLLEKYVPGDVYHVDAIADGERVLFAAAHRYASPPFDVAHGGGLFSSRTLERGSDEERELLEANLAVVAALRMVRGVLHTEFIRSRADQRFVFLETAARVGGANIVEMVEAATGINLWREWARLEVAHARGEPYRLPEQRSEYAAVLISLARQEWPETAAYNDPEIVWRMNKRHHAGLIVRSPDANRVKLLLDAYMPRFRDDFMAVLPAPDRPTA